MAGSSYASLCEGDSKEDFESSARRKRALIRKTSERKSAYELTSSVSSKKSKKFKQINQYRLVRHLGNGANGAVYLC